MAGYVNGEKLVTVSDLTLTSGGYPGLYATYSATFSNLFVNVPCTLGTCAPTMVQGICQFTCPTGYIASSNGTQVRMKRKPVWVSIGWAAWLRRVQDEAGRVYPTASPRPQVCTKSASGTTAFWTGPQLSCTLPPPYFPGAYIMTPESQPAGAAVGTPLIATSTSPSSIVLFTILSGDTNNAFWINACSG